MYPSATIRHYLKRGLRQLAEGLLELVWPTRCVGCEKHGTLLCGSCQEELSCIDQTLACPRCGAPLGRLVCTECTTVYEDQPKDLPFTQARCAWEFNRLSRRIITFYKDRGEQRLATLLAATLAGVIPLEWRLWADLVTWIPADAEAIKRRGFDHVAMIAVPFAQKCGLRINPLLMKRPHEDQRRLGREGRKRNMRAAFSLKEGVESRLPATMRNIILVDDVFTTGATLSAATEVLLAAGAKEVRVVTVCRVW
ncbi:MAG: double zinc ribbon domain-containing protein [Coriobacteriia bacterium]|nr:double zinc ribbon domain-containing protein [Coriobacteriia bacterium]